MTPEEMQEMFGDSDPFSDFFHTFFGGAVGSDRSQPRRGQSRARKGRDIEQEIQLGLDDAFHGTMRRFTIDHGGETKTVDVRIPPGVGD